MPSLFELQGWVALLLGVAALGIQAFALVDCLTQRPDAFLAASKRTKGFWLAITGVATALGFVSITNPLNLFSLVAVVAAAVYLADVRPAVRAVSGRGGSAQGPYGPW